MGLKKSFSFRHVLQASNFWREYAFIFREFKYFRQIAILAIIFTLIAAIFEGFGVGFIYAFLQSLTDPNAVPIQTGISWFDIGFLGVNTPANERIFRVSALILVVTWLRVIFTYLGAVSSEIARIKLVDRLRKQVFEQLQGLSLSYYSQTRSGELFNSLTTEIEQLQQAFAIVSFLIVRGSTLLAYAVSALLISWQLTIVSFILFHLLAVGITILLTHVRKASFARSDANGKFVSIAVEFINGIRTVQACATQDFERRRFYHASEQVVKTWEKSASVRSLIEPLSEGSAITILIGILFFAYAMFIPNGNLQSASLLTFLFVLFRLMPIVRQFNGARAQISNFQGSIFNIRELLRTDNKLYLQNGVIEFSSFKRELEFVSVGFGYETGKPVLQDINLIIEQGKTTAFIGSSGAGKSTLADLIPRFYDPTKGKILLDGIDLQKFDVNSLRRKIAVVSQTTFIFNTSVRDNIAYGLENVDNSAIEEAASFANALEFINGLPEGFDTVLGDRGVRLSGGQCQRIAIARALLRNPDILILDEATSALDSVTERLIQQSLEKLSIGRTVIAIAHRLSTIVRADKVVVLEGGRIVEQGGYQQLLEQRGKLWKYHQIQHEIAS